MFLAVTQPRLLIIEGHHEIKVSFPQHNGRELNISQRHTGSLKRDDRRALSLVLQIGGEGTKRQFDDVLVGHSVDCKPPNYIYSPTDIRLAVCKQKHV